MSFNSDLIPGQQQLFIYPHEFVNEEDLPFLTSSLLQNLYAENEVDIIRNHVLVLFETYGFRLERIRAVMITPTLDIAQNCGQDWSQYISSNVSTIVDQVADSASRSNNPAGKLSLKPKALKRKKQPIADKGSHKVFAAPRIKQRHIYHADIHALVFCQHPPLNLDFFVISSEAVYALDIEQICLSRRFDTIKR